MGYEILSDDILHSRDESPSRGPDKEPLWKRMLNHLNVFKLHLLTVLILLLAGYMFFFVDFDFDLGFDETQSGVLTLTGNFDTFNENYSGDLEIYSSKFSIISQVGQFDGESEDIKLYNFTGTINHINNSIVFNGTTDRLEFGKNKINTQNKAVTLTSSGKTNTKLLLQTARFENLNGMAKLDKSLNYEFENSSISIKNYLTTLSYDGTYSFSGIAEKFEIISPKHNLVINFDKNSSVSNSSQSEE